MHLDHCLVIQSNTDWEDKEKHCSQELEDSDIIQGLESTRSLERIEGSYDLVIFVEIVYIVLLIFME